MLCLIFVDMIYQEDVWCTKMPLSQDRLDDKLAVLENYLQVQRVKLWIMDSVVPASAVTMYE